jgi:hypothetical protein
MRSAEQIVTELVAPLGPVVAIARPGERLPALGAARISTDEWKDRVIRLMECARLVVLQVGLTPGFLWEMNTALDVRR